MPDDDGLKRRWFCGIVHILDGVVGFGHVAHFGLGGPLLPKRARNFVLGKLSWRELQFLDTEGRWTQNDPMRGTCRHRRKYVAVVGAGKRSGGTANSIHK